MQQMTLKGSFKHFAGGESINSYYLTWCTQRFEPHFEEIHVKETVW